MTIWNLPKQNHEEPNLQESEFESMGGGEFLSF
jgi:hypothetical protein